MCVKYFFKKEILAFVVVLFFCFPIGSAYADNASFGVWEKGGEKAFLFWEKRPVFAEEVLRLYQTDDVHGDESISEGLRSRNENILHSSKIEIPRYLKRVRFPLDSNIWLASTAKDFQVVGRTEHGIIISSRVCEFPILWEYDPQKEQWSEYSNGNIVLVPEGDFVSSALWILKLLKRNGCLDGSLVENYPELCVFSSKELKENGKNVTAQEIAKIIRERERVLRAAIRTEFSSEIESSVPES